MKKASLRQKSRNDAATTVCKPGFVAGRHLSVLCVSAKQAKSHTGFCAAAHRARRADVIGALLGVASDRVYRNPSLPRDSVSSCLAFPPLPDVNRAVYLCCTFPEVTFGGRYPLSLPFEARTFLAAVPRDDPTVLRQQYITKRGKMQVKRQCTDSIILFAVWHSI